MRYQITINFTVNNRYKFLSCDTVFARVIFSNTQPPRFQFFVALCHLILSIPSNYMYKMNITELAFPNILVFYENATISFLYNVSNLLKFGMVSGLFFLFHSTPSIQLSKVE